MMKHFYKFNATTCTRFAGQLLREFLHVQVKLHQSAVQLFPYSLSVGCRRSRQTSSCMLIRYAGSSSLPSQVCVDGRSVHPAASSPCLIQQVRLKSRKKHTEDDSDSDDDGTLEEDDFDAPVNFKMMKIHTASLRTDTIISNSLNIARNRLEEVFYGPGMLLNGEKMLKKSIKMEQGDFVDLVMDKEEDQFKVKRVKVIKIYQGQSNKGNLTVKVRVWKNPFLIDKPVSVH